MTGLIPKLKLRKVLLCCSRALSGVSEIYEGLSRGNRASLAKAITLTESTLPRHKTEAAELMLKVVSKKFNKSLRIGLSGPPGAGKSTFIETFGLHIIEQGEKVAVLAVDPSSMRTGGSLLADKTRMPLLTANPNAYIRPSPSRGELGGVARTTNDAILLCESAGYSLILVETVGAGQNEFAVANMVDLFVLLLPPGGGDELQGIKKGIVEVADMILITKADGNLQVPARLSKVEYSRALRLLRNHESPWAPFVMTISALTGENISEAWSEMQNYHSTMIECGLFLTRRREQQVSWLWSHVTSELINNFKSNPKVKELQLELENSVRSGEMSSNIAADKLLDVFLKSK